MSRHYVYALIDPRTAAPFYVGKGVSDRRFQHFKSAPIDKRSNPEKLRVLDAIKAAGLKPQAIVMSWHETQAEAYAAEKKAISRIGIEALTNQNEGGAGKLVSGTTSLGDEEQGGGRSLTAKQEKFCQLVVEGVNNGEAYREAYDSVGMKPATINREATRLMNNPIIATRIKQLRAPIVDTVAKTVEGQVQRIDELIEQAIATDQVGAALKGLELQSKLLDHFPAQKNVNENRNIDVNALTDRLQAGRDRVARLRVVGDE